MKITLLIYELYNYLEFLIPIDDFAVMVIYHHDDIEAIKSEVINAFMSNQQYV